jgi:TRAP-type C4-dicarboxylate transport system substrate-binding protein
MNIEKKRKFSEGGKTMMKRMMYLWLSLILVVGFSWVNSTQSVAAEKPIELNLSHIMSAVSYPHLGFQYYAKKINERTNGRVKITVYATGVLAPPAKVYESIVAGINDIGHHCSAYSPGPFPASEAAFLPLPAVNAYSFSRMATDFWAHFKLKELDKTIFFYAGTPGPYLIATVDKPVLKPEDLKGLKMRAIGPCVDLMKMWGGTPVSMPMGDVYEALSKKVIDGGILPLEAIASFKFGDHIKYATVAPVGVSFPGFVVMSLRKWNEMPKDIQEVFNRTNKEMIEWYAYVWQYGDLEGMNYFKALPGRKILEIPAAEKEAWIKLAKPLTDQYIKEKTAMGLPAADYVKYLWERGEYWNNNYPGDQKITAWVEKEIKKP